MRHLIAFLIMLMPAIAWADSQVLLWDWTGASAISGFKVYCGTATGVYPTTPIATTNATTKTATITIAAGARLFCVVRSYDAVAESASSNELIVYGRPDAPINLRTVP